MPTEPLADLIRFCETNAKRYEHDGCPKDAGRFYRIAHLLKAAPPAGKLAEALRKMIAGTTEWGTPLVPAIQEARAALAEYDGRAE